MNNLLRNIAIWLTIPALFLACTKETDIPSGGVETPADSEVLRVELSTLMTDFRTPVTRGLAREDELLNEPLWVLVFKGVDGNAVFEEARIAYKITELGKTYVDLRPQDDMCRVIILANTPELFNSNEFYPNSSTWSTFRYSETAFNDLFVNKTLQEVSDQFYTEPLGDPQESVPFVNQPLLMTAFNDVHISKGVKIEAYFERIVAKTIVINKSTDFQLLGVSAVTNAPKRGQLLYVASEMPQKNMELTDYLLSVDVVPTLNTENDPIYLYESHADNETCLIIKGYYKNDDEACYYKLKFVDTNKNNMHILRNRNYIFTIANISSRGYNTREDAMVSKALNIDFDYTITVIDESAYEITANNDYYLAVSNSVFIAYTDVGGVFDAFTWSTDCTKDFPNREISISEIAGISLAYPTFITFENGSYVTTPVQIYLTNYLKWNDNQAYTTIKLGNVEKNVLIRQRDAIPSVGVTLEYIPEASDDVYFWEGSEAINTNKVKYYCLSGSVENAATNDWITLSSSSGATGSNITVDDGRIYINIDRNGSNEKRIGTVYLTTIMNPYSESNSSNSVKRIKLSITQNYIPSLIVD